MIKHRNSRYGLRGIRVGEASNPGPRDSPGRHRRLRLIRGGVESSAREVPLRVGSLVSPPSTVLASSSAKRVRGGEEDFLDGLEEDLLASRHGDHSACRHSRVAQS